MINAWKKWRAERAAKAALVGLLADADRSAKALDIMLTGHEWYAGLRVVENGEDWIPGKPHIEVLITSLPQGGAGTFIPPRMGIVPVLVRFGRLVDDGL